MSFVDNLNTIAKLTPGQELALGSKQQLKVTYSRNLSKAVSFVGLGALVDDLDPILWHRVASDIESLSCRLLTTPSVEDLDLAQKVLNGLSCWRESLRDGGFPKGSAKVAKLCAFAKEHIRGLCDYNKVALDPTNGFEKLRSLDSDLEEYTQGSSQEEAALYIKEKIKLFGTVASWRLSENQRQVLHHLVQGLEIYEKMAKLLGEQRVAEGFESGSEAERIQGKVKDFSLRLVHGYLPSLEEGAAWEMGLGYRGDGLR